MIDFCPKCRKARLWKHKQDRNGYPIFRRVSKRGVSGYCVHTSPDVKHVHFPPDGLL